MQWWNHKIWCVFYSLNLFCSHLFCVCICTCGWSCAENSLVQSSSGVNAGNLLRPAAVIEQNCLCSPVKNTRAMRAQQCSSACQNSSCTVEATDSCRILKRGERGSARPHLTLHVLLLHFWHAKYQGFPSCRLWGTPLTSEDKAYSPLARSNRESEKCKPWELLEGLASHSVRCLRRKLWMSGFKTNRGRIKGVRKGCKERQQLRKKNCKKDIILPKFCVPTWFFLSCFVPNTFSLVILFSFCDYYRYTGILGSSWRDWELNCRVQDIQNTSKERKGKREGERGGMEQQKRGIGGEIEYLWEYN